jgi:hypothetical protein
VLINGNDAARTSTLAHESSAKVGHQRRPKRLAIAMKKSREIFKLRRFDHFFQIKGTI